MAFSNDKILDNLIQKEIRRQEETLDLIPSENFPSEEVLKIVGSPLMTKYSEGYPGKRYYPGNKYYDEIEILAQKQALQTFKLKPSDWSANVQPYSGSPANLAIYFALMNFRDTLMGMNLASGGHLTHGHKVNFSGKAYNAIQYGVNSKTDLLDYKEIEDLAEKFKPKVIVSGLTAYPRKIDFKRIGEIARKIGAYHVVDISHIAGLVAAELHQSPFPYADVVMTTTHKTLRGPRGAVIFSRKAKMIHDSRFMIHEMIDKAVFPGVQGGPHNNVVAAIAQMFYEVQKPDFKKYQKQILNNSKALAAALKKLGFELLTGGTDNHLMLIDLRKIKSDGMAAEKKLEENGILANRNSLPSDTSPFKPNGIRLGTPALTSRGMKEKEMKIIAELIHLVLIKNKSVKEEIKKLCCFFPLPYKPHNCG